ncbi:MAG: alpha-L-fucosidase [Janthinobacterium lividum]
MKRSSLIFCTLAGLLGASLIAAGLPVGADTTAAAKSVDPHVNETKAQQDTRMAWWRQARFGMFIHWGLYAVPAGVWHGKDTAGEFSAGAGEWMMHDLKIPVAPYAAQAAQFNPVQFSAETWVGIAKSAGMKYIVMTAKHHEGFAMYPTKVDGYNITDATPFKRDPIGEMAAACKKAGIKFGVYYSQNLDWHHPGGGTFGAAWDPAQKGSFDTYVKTVAGPQVTELITRYHPAVLWFDIPGEMTPDEVRALTVSFPKDPQLIYNNRMGGGVPGDTETPEQFIPAKGFPGKDWETCMTINNTWGYKTTDTDFKSSESLLRNLIDIASKGGNYLLNVGPDATGTIPAPEVERLQAIGAWMKVNGGSIYATKNSPYKRLPFDGRCTVKGNILYLNVFTWPAAGLRLTGLQTAVRGAKVLATGEALTVTKSADGTLTLSKPSTLDPVSTAIALTLTGPPVVTEAELQIAPLSDGSYALKAVDAALVGDTIQAEGGGDTADLGYWTNAQDAAQWKITVLAASACKYSAALEYSCEPGSEGSTFALSVDGIASGITGTVPKTTGWSDYQRLTLDGTLTLTGGVHTLEVKPLTKPGLAVMNLRRLTLAPVK